MLDFLRISIGNNSLGKVIVTVVFCVVCLSCLEKISLSIYNNSKELEYICRKVVKRSGIEVIKKIKRENTFIKVYTYNIAKRYLKTVTLYIKVSKNLLVSISI